MSVEVSEQLDERLTKEKVLARVPAFSPGILRVIDLLSKPNESATTLAQAISVDPALASQVLRLANSALFGSQQRIDTVPKAVVKVGHSWLQHLALTLGVNSYRKAAGQSEGLQRCWRHMLASAVLSRELARAVGVAADRAYAAGLLHDIGRLGLLASFPEQYAEVLDQASRGTEALLQEERGMFGTDHAELGRLLVESWNLPAEFAAVVGQHHAAPDSGSPSLGFVVQLSCRLADNLGFFFVPPVTPMALEEVRELLPPFARSRFPEDPAQLTAMVEESMRENNLGVAESFEPCAELEPIPETPTVSEQPPARNTRWIWLVVAAILIVAAVLLRRFL